MLKLTLVTDNAAFKPDSCNCTECNRIEKPYECQCFDEADCDCPCCNDAYYEELTRVFQRITTRLEKGDSLPIKALDTNGNVIGKLTSI